MTNPSEQEKWEDDNGHEEPEINTVAAKHFLADLDDCGDLNARLAELIDVEIRRVEPKLVKSNDPEDLPYQVVACEWRHYDDWGPLTEDKFNEDLDGALADLATFLDSQGVFRAYPIQIFPPTTYGRAFHDWIGEPYPFDLRFIIEYGPMDTGQKDDNGEPVMAYGLNFNLGTLLGKDG